MLYKSKKNINKMAKKKTKKSGSNDFDFSKISNVVEHLSKKSMITIENIGSDRGYISTGIRILDALLSKSIKSGGVPKNRITIFAGPPQTGKSYIALSIVRNAQKEGYNIIYIDTEFAIEKSDFDMFGVDTSDPAKFMLLRSNRVENIKIFLTQLLSELKTQKEKGVDVSKTLIVLDSIGQLASNKEIEDALDGKNKQDMSRAKAIKSLFRIINSDLGYLNIPLVATNHVYLTQDLFPQMVQSGGEGINYSASIIVYLTISKLKSGDMDDLDIGQSGVIVTAKSRKNRLAKPKKVKFELDHSKGVNPYKGLEFFCTPENFEKVGIAKVKKNIDKSTGEISYVEGGIRYYVKHLDKFIYDKNLYNSEVFNDDVINSLEPIIYDYFKYSSYEDYQKELEKLDEQYSKFEKDDDNFDIDMDDDTKLFE